MKQALVTGGTGGIGLGVSEALLKTGWQVVATGVSEEEVSSCPVMEHLTATQLDVTDPDAISRVVGGLGRLDGLVNCAGILMRGAEYDIGNFQKVIDVNLTGTMRMCLAALPLLSDAPGAIVNTASMLSFFGGPEVPAYSASKGGVAQLTRALAAKWAEQGVRVNAVAPGWIETPMTDGLRADTDREAAILSRTPVKRWGLPAEVGSLAAWLLSAEAGFVTGAVYPVDGGYSAV